MNNLSDKMTINERLKIRKRLLFYCTANLSRIMEVDKIIITVLIHKPPNSIKSIIYIFV